MKAKDVTAPRRVGVGALTGTALAEIAIAHLSVDELSLTLRVFPRQRRQVFAILGQTLPALGTAPTDAEIARWFLSACRAAAS